MATNHEYTRRPHETTSTRERPTPESPRDEARLRYAQRQEEWTWEKWGYRVEQEWHTVARNIQTLLGGAVGALLGITIAAIPTAFLDRSSYSLVLAQPVGAAIGAIVGGIAMLWLSRSKKKASPPPTR